jgi:CHRD domain
MLQKLLLAVIFAASMLLTTVAVGDGGQSNTLRAVAPLRPTSEVPALSSQAHGRFKATIDVQNQTIGYELTYDGLEGDVLQAHIHVGQRGVNGGISVFLCGNPPQVPPAPVPRA